MVNISGTTINMVNGDTANININIENYVAADDDKLYFGVKNNINSTDYMLFKECTKNDLLPGSNNIYVVSITSEESNNMGIGTFIYDVQLNRPSLGTVDTIIRPSSFTIVKGVVENKTNTEGVV